MDGPVAAARIQLRRHPQGVECVRELGRRRPRGGQAQARGRRAGARRGARAAGEFCDRRLVARDRRDAARLAVADHARARALARLRLPPPPPLHGRRGRAGSRRAGPHRLARQGARVSDYVAGGVAEREVPRGSGLGAWGMAMLVASEATLFGTFIGTYYYLRFVDVPWPLPGTPEPRVVVPLVMAGALAATSVPMWLAGRALRGGQLGSTRALVVLALVVQCGYF